jgi:hypothetical protein
MAPVLNCNTLLGGRSQEILATPAPSAMELNRVVLWMITGLVYVKQILNPIMSHHYYELHAGDIWRLFY